MRGTVIAVDPTEKDMLVRTDAGAQRRLDAPYVAEHLQHAYVLTAHTIQGATVQWAGVVGCPEDFTRNWSYTALSRAREPTELFLLDTPTERDLDRAEIAPDQPAELGDQRTPVERLDAAMRRRDDEDLALDRIDAERNRRPSPPRARTSRLPAGATIAHPPVVELQAELAQLHERIARYPEHLVDQLHAARSAQAEAQRVADAGRTRIAELDQPAAACCAGGPRTPPRCASSANASSSLSSKRLRPASASATSRTGSPTARHGRPNAASSASAPPSSTRSSRPAAASTFASSSSDQLPTSR